MTSTDSQDDAHSWEELPVDKVARADTVSVEEVASNMLLVTVDDTIFPVQNTPKNHLLYNRDDFAINGKSLYTILHTNPDKRIVISEEPYAAVSTSQFEESYRLWYDDPDGYMVKTPVSRATDVLQGIIDAFEENDCGRLNDIYYDVLDDQVRREKVNLLLDPELSISASLPADRIDVLPEGWLIDGMFLLTWDAEVFLYTENWRSGSYQPRTSEQNEEPGQFMEVQPSSQSILEPREEQIFGDDVRFGEKECLFIYRATWFLDWKHHLDDEAQADVIQRTYEEYRHLF